MSFDEKIKSMLGGPLRAAAVDVLQVNIGYRCNLSCKHCHYSAGPQSDVMMQARTVDACLSALDASGIATLDITGGAPELNPEFRRMVSEARAMGRNVIARSNLAVFFDAGHEDMPEFLASERVEVVASMPFYIKSDVDRVRGGGTYGRIVRAIRKLNALGYGKKDSGLRLNLVFNPMGAFLPPAQEELEKTYRQELARAERLEFNSLYTFANMPIGRFRDFLERTGKLEQYMNRLKGAFNPCTLEGIMCRRLISVGPDGTLYDCDFNQALGLPLAGGGTVFDFNLAVLAQRPIALDEHCYACTAGQGST